MRLILMALGIAIYALFPTMTVTVTHGALEHDFGCWWRAVTATSGPSHPGPTPIAWLLAFAASAGSAPRVGVAA